MKNLGSVTDPQDLATKEYVDQKVGEAGGLSKTDIINFIYPVGAIFMGVNNVNPSTFLGGTWVAWGTGRVPVGVDVNDDSFNSVEKTGGESTHKLTNNEMPSHNHSDGDLSASSNGAHTHTVSGTAAENGAHDHSGSTVLAYNSSSPGFATNGTYYKYKSTTFKDACSDAGAHTHSVSGTAASSGAHTHDVSGSTGNTGGGGPHNNLQPYITCYMWKRTA